MGITLEIRGLPDAYDQSESLIGIIDNSAQRIPLLACNRIPVVALKTVPPVALKRISA